MEPVNLQDAKLNNPTSPETQLFLSVLSGSLLHSKRSRTQGIYCAPYGKYLPAALFWV